MDAKVTIFVDDGIQVSLNMPFAPSIGHTIEYGSPEIKSAVVTKVIWRRAFSDTFHIDVHCSTRKK